MKINFKPTELKKIAKKYQLNYLVFFGSRALGEERKNSDFDLAYSSQKEIKYSEETFLQEDLARLFNISTIDLVNTKQAGPLLQKEIAVNGRLIKEFTKDSFDNFQIFALMNYFETKPLFRMQEEYIQRNLRSR
jgi:predicted nucleotidyltransferase